MDLADMLLEAIGKAVAPPRGVPAAAARRRRLASATREPAREHPRDAVAPPNRLDAARPRVADHDAVHRRLRVVRARVVPAVLPARRRPSGRHHVRDRVAVLHDRGPQRRGAGDRRRPRRRHADPLVVGVAGCPAAVGGSDPAGRHPAVQRQHDRRDDHDVRRRGDQSPRVGPRLLRVHRVPRRQPSLLVGHPPPTRRPRQRTPRRRVVVVVAELHRVGVLHGVGDRCVHADRPPARWSTSRSSTAARSSARSASWSGRTSCCPLPSATRVADVRLARNRSRDRST